MHFDRAAKIVKRQETSSFSYILCTLTLDSRVSDVSYRETNLRLGNRLRLLPHNSLQASMPTVFLYCLPADFNENHNLDFLVSLVNFTKTCTNILIFSY